MVGTKGVHILLELWQVSELSLSDFSFMKSLLLQSVVESGATLVGTNWKKYKPSGMTGILLLAESHISVHTWPERGYAALDIYTCGSKAIASKAMKYIIEKLHPGKYHALTITRGIEETGKMLIKNDEVS